MQTVTELKLAHNYSINQNIIPVVHVFIYQTQYLYIPIFDMLIQFKFVLILYHWLNVSRYGDISIYIVASLFSYTMLLALPAAQVLA